MRRFTSTDRAAFNTDDITRLLLVCNDKSQEGGMDIAGQEHNQAWEHIGAQIEALLHYSVCCACLALVHREDWEVHPCGRCDCSKPLVVSEGHPHETDAGPGVAASGDDEYDIHCEGHEFQRRGSWSGDDWCAVDGCTSRGPADV